MCLRPLDSKLLHAPEDIRGTKGIGGSRVLVISQQQTEWDRWSSLSSRIKCREKGVLVSGVGRVAEEPDAYFGDASIDGYIMQ